MKLYGGSLETLEHALDVRGQRHTVLAGNLANADTPGFSPVDIPFEQAMQDAARAAADADAAEASGETASAPRPLESVESDALATAAGLDGNRVDVDRTLAALAENGLQYTASARAAGKELAILRYVVSDGAG